MDLKVTVTLSDLPDVLKKRLGQVVRKTALDIEADAKQRAPKDTGFLAASIQADVSHADSDLAAEVAVGAEYGIFVELGTVTQAPQPFLTPAMEAERGEFERALGEVLKP